MGLDALFKHKFLQSFLDDRQTMWNTWTTNQMDQTMTRAKNLKVQPQTHLANLYLIYCLAMS